MRLVMLSVQLAKPPVRVHQPVTPIKICIVEDEEHQYGGGRGDRIWVPDPSRLAIAEAVWSQLVDEKRDAKRDDRDGHH